VIPKSALYDLLIGVPPIRVVAEAVEAGLSEDEATLAVATILADPLVETSRAIGARLRSREWMNRVYSSLAASSDRPLVVERRDAVTREEFFRDYYYANRPVLLPGIGRGCPAVTRWTEDYLLAHCGDVTVTVMHNRDGASPSEQYTGDKQQTSVRLREFLDRVFRGGPSNDWYLVAKNNFFDRRETAGLLRDLLCLPFVDMQSPHGGVSLWLGPAGTVTPLHCDPSNGFLLQVAGRKRLRLYAPCCAAYMEQAGMWYAGTDPQTVAAASGTAPPVESAFVMEPGDGLFIPVGWWHAVTSETPSITVTSSEFGVPNTYWP
jgi:ribosomal protein L16 Arg81 hydroxylase